MTWFSKYRFTLTHPVAGTRVVTPVNDDILIRGRRESRFVWRRELPAELVFKKADFEWLYAIETGADRCEKIALLVETKCAGTWQTFYEGFLTCDSAQWNPRGCIVRMTPRIEDTYTCIFENWKEEKNLLSIGTSYTVTGLVGTVETLVCGFDAITGVTLTDPPTNNDCWSDANAWTVLENRLDLLEESTPGLYDGDIRTTWVRERVDSSPSMPAGNGWISIGGDSWVRPVATQFVSESVTTPDEISYFILQTYELTGDITIDNARSFTDVLEYFNPCPDDYTIQSDFFRVNDGALPSTDPYNAAADGFDQIAVWQKSDVVRPNANYNAQKGITTFEKLIGWLRTMFNAEWKVEGSIIRIEHLSYFEGSEGLDLTLPPYDDQIENKTSYQYNNAAKPHFERFSWMDKVTAHFEGDPIIYDNACSDKEKNSEQFYRVDEVSTDIAFMSDNEEDVSLLGFAMAAVYDNGAGGYYINTDDGFVNGHLGWTNLHDNYYRHGRPQLTGNMNGTDETFESAYPSKEQEILAVQIECSEFLSFDPGALVQTQLGWGEVMSWEYSAKKCQLTLQISHQ